MIEKRFKDIEISADTGEVRLYTTDTDYEEYISEQLLELVNDALKLSTFKKVIKEEYEKTEEYNQVDTAMYHARKQLLQDIIKKVGINYN